jgi:hypothetical protein
MRIPISENGLGCVSPSGKHGAFFYSIDSSYYVNYLYTKGFRICTYVEFKELYPYISKWNYYNYRLNKKE